MNANEISVFPRRVLLCVTGLTPQVVTETLYALAVQSEQPFVPTEIHVISTLVGVEYVRQRLLDLQQGYFYQLCRDYDLTGIAFPESNVHAIKNTAGQPMHDIRTPDDNTCAADYILCFVRDLCADEHASVHVSIAGGRKSMGFFAGYALSVFGRRQDRLSHVLVNEPFEFLVDFFYPPAKPKALTARDGHSVYTSDARIMLADIPFIRWRESGTTEQLGQINTWREAVTAFQQ